MEYSTYPLNNASPKEKDYAANSDITTNSLLGEVVTLLKINNAHQGIITCEQITENDIENEVR